MPFKLGPMEIIIILVIILVIFGVGRLPQVGAAMGKTMRAFKTGQADDEDEEPAPRKVRKKAVKKTEA